MLRAVLVDDDPDVRAVVRHVLADAGHEIVGETENAAHGAEMARWADVVVLDWSIPGMTGEEAVTVIRAAKPSVEIVVLSAFEPEPGTAARLRLRDWVDKTDLPRVGDVLAEMDDSSGD